MEVLQVPISAKGARGERELANYLSKRGFDCARNIQGDEKGNAENPDVIGLDGIYIECKRVESLNIHKAMQQAINDAEGKRTPTVMHRRNRADWLVTMRLDDWLELYKGGK